MLQSDASVHGFHINERKNDFKNQKQKALRFSHVDLGMRIKRPVRWFLFFCFFDTRAAAIHRIAQAVKVHTFL